MEVVEALPADADGTRIRPLPCVHNRFGPAREEQRPRGPEQCKAGPFRQLKPLGRISRSSIQTAMKSSARIAALFALAIGAQLNACPAPVVEASPHGCILRIGADGLRNAKGVVGVVLFTSPAGWPEDVSKSFRHDAASIADGERNATVEFKDIPPGDYGVVALHDENGNMKLDKNMFGIPKEGFGFANNPPVGFGPPAFRRALLHVACPSTEGEIHIIYK